MMVKSGHTMDGNKRNLVRNAALVPFPVDATLQQRFANPLASLGLKWNFEAPPASYFSVGGEGFLSQPPSHFLSNPFGKAK